MRVYGEETFAVLEKTLLPRIDKRRKTTSPAPGFHRTVAYSTPTTQFFHVIYLDQTGGQAPVILKKCSLFFLAR
jgi:hypothetical protein